jgi:hypothetical protein
MDSVTEAVVAAIAKAPCSLAKLAETAGVPASTLVRIRQGERLATLDVAQKVAIALEGWGRGCSHAAQAIRRVTVHPPRRRKAR